MTTRCARAAGARVRDSRLRGADRAGLRPGGRAGAAPRPPSSRSSISRCPARAGSSWSRRSTRSIPRPRPSCSPATAASPPRSMPCGSARRTTCRSPPTPTTSSPRSRAARRRRSTASSRRLHGALARARGVGAHQPRALRLRGQHLRGRAPARYPSPQAAAQAAEVSATGLGHRVAV